MRGSTAAWFACPHCGEDLRQGAIRCAHCDRSLLSAPPPTGVRPGEESPFIPPPAGPGPEPPWERRPDWGGSPPKAVSGDRGIAVWSCVIGGVLLAVPLVFRLLGMVSPSSILYLAPFMVLAPGGLAGLLVRILGLVLGIQGKGRIAGSGDVRGMTIAKVGIWIGCVNIVLWVVGFVLPSLSLFLWLTNGVPP